MNLFDQGKVHFLLFTGGPGVGDRFSEAESAKRVALRHGVPAEKILSESCSRENLWFAKQVLGKFGLGHLKIVLISDDIHLFRSSLMAYILGMKHSVSPTPYSMYKSSTKRLGFLWNEIKNLPGLFKIYTMHGHCDLIEGPDRVLTDVKM